MIIFRKLTFKNLLSVGNQPVTINLDKCKTTLVHGVNGSGKSTILDALTYSLFGKSFRGVNLGQLINTQNKKGLLVECEFNVGKDAFLIRRGTKPKVFEIYKNKEIIESKANDRDNQAYLEKSILKLTYKSFTQIVILGSSNFVPFMQLPAASRRECVEDFLDIKVFSTMAVMAKERLRGLQEQLRNMANDISTQEFKIEAQQEKINHMEQADDRRIQSLKDEINHEEVELLKHEGILKMWKKDMKVLADHLKEEVDKGSSTNIRKLNTVIIQLNAKLDRLSKDKQFFSSHANCPTCSQPITAELSAQKQADIGKEMQEVDSASIKAATMLQGHEETDKVVQELKQRAEEWKQKVHVIETDMMMCKRNIDRCQSGIDDIEKAKGSIDQERGKYSLMVSDLEQKQLQKDELVERVSSHDIAATLLKDSGIKTQVVRRYLPAMNKYIRHYLSELDMPIHFQLDEEFGEHVSSPLHQDFTYSSFSEGQKGRIDLALMLTWREICGLKNSVSTNLLILDEVFSSSLDETGKECLLALLRFKIPDEQRVLVVDHTLSSTFREKFDHSVEVVRKGGFSHYET